MRYKGVYRLKCPWDIKTNQYSRKLDGTLEDIDVYIDCYHGNKVFHYGHTTLQAYIPSLQRGHNILKAIEEEENKEKIFDIEETDSEVLFKFNSKHIEEIIKHLKPKTSGCNISPFSSRNLPQNKSYKIPDEDLVAYKSIVSQIPRERILELTHRSNMYLKSLVNKKNSWDDIKADMAAKGLKGKEYIHSVGRWNEYIDYLKNSLEGV